MLGLKRNLFITLNQHLNWMPHWFPQLCHDVKTDGTKLASHSIKHPVKEIIPILDMLHSARTGVMKWSFKRCNFAIYVNVLSKGI